MNLRSLLLRCCTLLMVVLSFAIDLWAQPRGAGGLDTIVIYNANRQPVRRIPNLAHTTTCGSVSADNFALASNQSFSVYLTGKDGENLQTTEFEAVPDGVTGYDDSYLVFLRNGNVALLGLDGAVKERLSSKFTSAAIKHPQGGVVAVTSGKAELSHFSWGGSAQKSYSSRDAGRPVLFERLVFSAPGTIIAVETNAQELVFFDLELKEQRRVPFPTDKLTGLFATPSYLFATRSDLKGVEIVSLDGTRQQLVTTMPVSCAGGLQNGEFFLGFSAEDRVSFPVGQWADFNGNRARLTYDCLAAIIAYALFGSLLFGYLWNKLFSKPTMAAQQEEEAPPETSPLGWKRWIGITMCVGALIWGSYLSVAIFPAFQKWGTPLTWRYFGAAVALVTLGILIAGRLVGGYRLFRPFKALSAPLAGNSISFPLLAISISLGAVYNYLNQNALHPKVIVATWLAAQVLFVMAFRGVFLPSSNARWSRSHIVQVAVLCFVGTALRVVYMGEYPEDISFDFGVIADGATAVLIEEWYPFFILETSQTVGRPWLTQMAAALWAFGLHDVTIRITSVVWALGFIISSYLIGRETVSHRFGMIFGALVAAQHNMLSYSRLPYVTESTAPFLFCLYYVCRGMKRGSLRDFAVAGIWAGWSMMSVRQFATFPFIGVAILLYVAIVHWRTIWRYGVHIVVLLMASAIVFSPYYNFYTGRQHLSYRLSGVSPLFWDYKFTTDINVWIYQFSAAFGGLIRIPDRISWPSENLAPICLGVTAVFFCAGVVFLLTRFRTLGAPIALLTMSVSIALGSAFIENPPTYYHHFVGIALAMYFVAIPIELLFDISSRARAAFVRVPLSLSVVAVAGLCVIEQAKPFYDYAKRPVDSEGNEVERRNLYSLLCRHILENAEHRFIAVSNGENYFDFHHSNLANFYGEFSERYDVHAPVQLYLPMRPVGRSKPLEFILMTGHSDKLSEIQKVYPKGESRTFRYNTGAATFMTYTVSTEEATRVYNEVAQRGGLLFPELFALKPR